jgi:hypothetical protein
MPPTPSLAVGPTHLLSAEDRKARPLVGFERQRELLVKLGGAGAGSVAGGDGLDIRLDRVLTSPEIAALATNRAAAAIVGRVVHAAADRLLDRVRKVSRRTYRKGLFYSGWRAKVGSRGGVRSNIELTNQAPYALYVHRKGAPITETVVNTYVKPLVREVAAEVLDELVAVMKRQLVAAALAPLRSR